MSGLYFPSLAHIGRNKPMGESATSERFFPVLGYAKDLLCRSLCAATLRWSRFSTVGVGVRLLSPMQAGTA